MKIGIDIDDVVTESGKCVIEHAQKHEHLYCDNQEITSNLKDLIRGNLINDPMKKFVRAYVAQLWESVELKPNAVKTLSKIKSKGHQLIFITSRSSSMDANCEKITYEYFKKHKIPYDKIIFGVHDKKQTCLDEKIDIFIDDSVDFCNYILSSTDIDVYLFNSEINKDLPCDAKRIYSWPELEEIINAQ